jgi:hypothetical protein
MQIEQAVSQHGLFGDIDDYNQIDIACIHRNEQMLVRARAVAIAVRDYTRVWLKAAQVAVRDCRHIAPEIWRCAFGAVYLAHWRGKRGAKLGGV